jgi:3-methylfumaryl-CoA hydratase
VIRSVTTKSGRSGSLAFVTVGYSFTQQGVLCLEEEQDIVYREPGSPVPAPVPIELPPPPSDAWSRVITPDPRLLFRFSALTFNAHRIHYDRPYATGVEGYPGLVVHGPLTAVLLLELVRRNTPRRAVGFSFRGLAPLFDLAPFRLVAQPSGDNVALEAQGPDGKPAMSAEADLG